MTKLKKENLRMTDISKVRRFPMKSGPGPSDRSGLESRNLQKQGPKNRNLVRWPLSLILINFRLVHYKQNL